MKKSIFCFLLILIPVGFCSGGNFDSNGGNDLSGKQQFLIELDYGFPLLTGITLGYLIDPHWEVSAGTSFNTSDSSFGGSVDFFRLTLQGRYNLSTRKRREFNLFQTYLHFGYDFISGTTSANSVNYYENGVYPNANTTEHDLLVGLGIEYFILSNLGVGLTMDYMKSFLRTNSVPGYAVFSPPYYSWDSYSPTNNTSIVVPNFYLQFRF